MIGLQEYVKEGKIQVNEDDSVLSYLTMAHIFGRVLEEFAISCGAAIGYWQASMALPPVPRASMPCSMGIVLFMLYIPLAGCHSAMGRSTYLHLARMLEDCQHSASCAAGLQRWRSG